MKITKIYIFKGKLDLFNNGLNYNLHKRLQYLTRNMALEFWERPDITNQSESKIPKDT
jgi:hypothetical protein